MPATIATPVTEAVPGPMPSILFLLSSLNLTTTHVQREDLVLILHLRKQVQPKSESHVNMPLPYLVLLTFPALSLTPRLLTCPHPPAP